MVHNVVYNVGGGALCALRSSLYWLLLTRVCVTRDSCPLDGSRGGVVTGDCYSVAIVLIAVSFLHSGVGSEVL